MKQQILKSVGFPIWLEGVRCEEALRLLPRVVSDPADFLVIHQGDSCQLCVKGDEEKRQREWQEMQAAAEAASKNTECVIC